MKRFFLDTNVLIDFLANRQPFSAEAAQLFNLAAGNKLVIFISAISYNNIYYILRQQMSNAEAMQLLSDLSDLCEVADVTKAVIAKSIHAGFSDFEDAIQYYSALSVDKIDAIVTRNQKDFKKSSIPVLSPKEALSMIEAGQ